MPRSVTIRAFCAALLLATATAGQRTAAETVEIANPTLSVVLAIPDGRLTVTDRRCDMVWRQHVPVRTAQGSDWGKNVRTNTVGTKRLLRIERASVREGTIHAAASWLGHPFGIRFELPEEGAELTVVIGAEMEDGLRARYLRTYRDVCGWHEKIGFDEMTDHRLLTPDRLVQETRFSSGHAVVVNFGSAAWEDPRGFVVPGSSFYPFHVTIGE